MPSHLPRTLFLLATLGLLASPATAGGVSDERLPPTWKVFHIEMRDTPGNFVRIGFHVTWGGPAALYVVDYDDNGVPPDPGWCAFSGTGLHAGGSLEWRDVDTELVEGQGAATCGMAIDPEGHRDVVLLISGDLRTLDVFLEGTGTLEQIAEGLAQERSGHDLAGSAFADANALDLTARASILRSVEFTIDGYLFGWFLTPLGIGESVGVATLTSANSTDHCGLNDDEAQPIYLRTKGCAFTDFAGPDARGAGNYRLDWTGTQAVYGHTPLMAWADIPASVAPCC